jgi:VanZ family protein
VGWHPIRARAREKKSTYKVKKVPFLDFFYFQPFSLQMIQILKKYLGNIIIPLSWTLLIGILLSLPGSMLPSESGFKIPQFDKIVHISMFGFFVFSWNLYFSSRKIPAAKLLRVFFYIFLLANAYGIGMEYVQKYFIPLRDFDEADIIADMIGAGLAYGISNLFLVKIY